MLSKISIGGRWIMTNLELIGAGLGGLGSLLLIPKVENRNFIIGTSELFFA